MAKKSNEPVVKAEAVRTVIVAALGYLGWELSESLLAVVVAGGVALVSWGLSALSRSQVKPMAKVLLEEEYPLVSHLEPEFVAEGVDDCELCEDVCEDCPDN